MTKKTDTPAIRFKGFSDTWEQRKVTEIGKIYIGLVTTMTKHYTDEGTLLIRNSDIKDGKFEFGDNPIYLEKTFAEKNETRMHQIGDVITVHTGDVGTSAVITENEAKSIGFATIVTRPNPKIIDSNYLCSFLNTDKHKKWAVSISTGDGRTNYNLGDYFELVVPVPSIAEQKKIASYIQKLNRLITLHQRKYEKLHNIKKSMLEKMFPKNGSNVPEIRFKGFTEAWEQRKLGELGTITTGNTPSTSIPDYYSDDGIVWVTPTDICENVTFDSARKLSDLGQQVGRVVPKNTILVTCIASIGKNTMLGNTGSFNQQINGLTPNENKCDPYFLLTESALWSAKMKGSAAAGTMQIVNRTEFSELKTWLPSLIEQQAIGVFFKQLDNLITLHQRELEKLQNIKKSMLEKMFV